MNVQDIVFYVGIAAFVVGGIFLALAAQMFISQDIRGVMADLSGQARGGARTRTAQGTGRGVSRTRRPQRHRFEETASTGTGQSQMDFNTSSEDGIDAIVDTALREAHRNTSSEDSIDFIFGTAQREAHRNAMGISNDSTDINDDMSTLVTSMAEFPNRDGAEAGNNAELPTAVEGSGGVAAGSFRLTRSIVAISSNEVISVSEE